MKKADRRLVEWGKNLLILLLTMSALYLMAMLPLIQDSGLFQLLNQTEPSNRDDHTLTAAALPSAMAVTIGEGRYGVQYDQEAMDELFTRLGPLLGEALASAEEPEVMDEQRWQNHLSRPGIYFDFSGEIPLSALCIWLSGERHDQLENTARQLLLAAGEGDEVLLCYQDVENGLFYICSTALSQSLHLIPNLEGYGGNGAYFAFEDTGMATLLKPYTLITEGEGAWAQFSSTNPLADPINVDSLLSALAFNEQNHAPVSSGEAYLDGKDRLQINQDGTVTYRAGQGEKYPVNDTTVAGAIEAARDLAQHTIGALCGEARLYLISAREEEGRYLIRFGYQLNGSDLYLYNEGWAAQFLIQKGCVAEFTLHFRTYTAMEEDALLLPIDKAAVMLPDLTQERQELSIQYRDRGGTVVGPVWAAS